MKNFTMILVLFAILSVAVGCQKNSSPVGPTASTVDVPTPEPTRATP
jgi:hypothetical protein